MNRFILTVLCLSIVDLSVLLQSCDPTSNYATCPDNQWCYDNPSSNNSSVCLFFHQTPGSPCLQDEQCEYLCDYSIDQCVYPSGYNMTCHANNPNGNVQCATGYQCDLASLVCVPTSSSSSTSSSNLLYWVFAFPLIVLICLAFLWMFLSVVVRDTCPQYYHPCWCHRGDLLRKRTNNQTEQVNQMVTVQQNQIVPLQQVQIVTVQRTHEDATSQSK